VHTHHTPAQTNPSNQLLIAVDESPASDRTLAWALDNVLREGDAVQLLHVIPPGQRLVLSPDLGVDGIVEVRLLVCVSSE
jgi:nucleotide-binding universal stress UspA family protein